MKLTTNVQAGLKDWGNYTDKKLTSLGEIRGKKEHGGAPGFECNEGEEKGEASKRPGRPQAMQHLANTTLSSDPGGCTAC